jgi:hypothetical protein
VARAGKKIDQKGEVGNVVAKMLNTKAVDLKLPATLVVRGVAKKVAAKDAGKPKVVNPPGKAGVKLDALTAVRVRVWLNAVKDRARCPVAELATRYDMPNTARFDLYDKLERRPQRSTLQAVDKAVSNDAPREQPFRGTSLVYLHGPGALQLWNALEGAQRICRTIVNDELNRVFSKQTFRWGLPFSRKVEALTRIVPGAVCTDMYGTLVRGEPHPVTLQFSKAIRSRDIEARELAIETWQSYFVTAIAVWQIAQVNKDSFQEADFLLLGVLAGPLEKIFPNLGAWLREFVVKLMLEKTDKKNPERHDIIRDYMKAKMQSPARADKR